jgi:hypothetical protein
MIQGKSSKKIINGVVRKELLDERILPLIRDLTNGREKINIVKFPIFSVFLRCAEQWNS